MYKINLIGDINASGGDNTINYDALTAELDNANGQDLEITINTLGGHVDEAFKIYDALEQYKINNKAVITTITDEECASSGVILLLAGNRRIVNNNSQPFVHKAMFKGVNKAVNSSQLNKLANDLKECDQMIAELYAKKTALSVEEALNLMDNDTSLTPEESYSLGFATELSKIYNHKPKSAKLIIQNKLNKNMSKEQTFFEMAKNFFLGLDKEENNVIQNKIELTVSDAELDFYELDADTTPSIGDKAQFEGKPAEGDFKMKKGVEYKFEGGVLKEIEEEKEEEVIIEVENKKEIVNLFEITYSLSLEDKRSKVVEALKSKGFNYPWLVAIFDNYVIFQNDWEGVFHKAEYIVNEDNSVFIGQEIKEVFTTYLTSEELNELKNKSDEKDVEIQNLKTELETKNLTIEKYNKLESQFLAENKKEQRESKEVETELNKTDWSIIKNNLKNKK